MTRPLTVCCVLMLSVGLFADDLNVQQDPRADLSGLSTFALRRVEIKSPRPELDNPLFAKKVVTTIRAALTARGLTETKATPELFVDVVLTGEDFSGIEPGTGRGTGPRSVRYTEGTLVIDLTRPGHTNPVWRGVYRDDEETGSELVRKLPEDAKKLIDRYPRRTK